MLELERLEQASPLLQRFVEHGPIVDPQQVEDDQRHRNLAPELLVDDLATEAMLQLEKAKDASVAMGQHLAVEHHAVRESQRRLCELRKRGGRLFQVAREHLDAAVDVVQLAPHAVVLLLRPDLAGAHAVEGFLRCFDRAREHEAEWLEGRHLRRLELLVLASHRDRKSTRLNSSHPSISYAVFCLKK